VEFGVLVVVFPPGLLPVFLLSSELKKLASTRSELVGSPCGN
jgi:hypothetical protein